MLTYLCISLLVLLLAHMIVSYRIIKDLRARANHYAGKAEEFAQRLDECKIRMMELLNILKNQEYLHETR